jgi:hypothetical protein
MGRIAAQDAANRCNSPDCRYSTERRSPFAVANLLQLLRKQSFFGFSVTNTIAPDAPAAAGRYGPGQTFNCSAPASGYAALVSANESRGRCRHPGRDTLVGRGLRPIHAFGHRAGKLGRRLQARWYPRVVDKEPQSADKPLIDAPCVAVPGGWRAFWERGPSQCGARRLGHHTGRHARHCKRCDNGLGRYAVLRPRHALADPRRSVGLL